MKTPAASVFRLFAPRSRLVSVVDTSRGPGMPAHYRRLLNPVCLIFAVLAPPLMADFPRGRVEGPAERSPANLLLRTHTPKYVNYAHQNFVNYDDHAPPYADHPRAYFGAMGDYLATGYELFSWTENRGFDDDYGSAIFKDINVFRPIFDLLLGPFQGLPAMVSLVPISIVVTIVALYVFKWTSDQ